MISYSSSLRWFVVIAWCLPALVGSESPNLSGDWSWKMDSGVRFHIGPRGAGRQRIHPDLFIEAGRRVISWPISEEEVRDLHGKGLLIEHIKPLMQSHEDILLRYDPAKGDLASTYVVRELEPILSPDQEVYRKVITETWLAPVPEGYRPVGQGGSAVIATWRPYWAQQARVRVGRRSMDKDRGMIEEEIFWFDREMTADAMLLEARASFEPFELREALGFKMAFRRMNHENDHRYPGVFWQSGCFLVRIKAPKRIFETVLRSYIERYPPTWQDTVSDDPVRLALHVLDVAIPEMEAHMDGPLEYLRYSYRQYPFDKAFHRARRVLPPEAGNNLGREHESSTQAIHEAWSSAPPETIILEDYRVAILAHRQSLIDQMKAAQKRIRTHGIALSPERYWIYGDTAIEP